MRPQRHTQAELAHTPPHVERHESVLTDRGNEERALGGHLKTGHRSTVQNRPPRAWRPRPSVVDRVVVLWSSVLLSFTTTSLGCANVGISRSLRDFQSPVETVLWFPWGCHLHQPSSASSTIEPIVGDAVPLPACRSSFLEAPTRSFGSADPSSSSESVPLPRGRARHMVLLRGLVGAQVGLDLGTPAPRSALEDVRVMEQPIEERGDGGRVAEQLPPIVHRSV